MTEAADVLARLLEAEETLRAIRNGEVDALIVQDGSPVAQVFTLASADRPYRMFVENMRDGAATVSQSGIVLYANRRLAALLARPLDQLMGAAISSFVADGDRAALDAISGLVRGTVEVDRAPRGAMRKEMQDDKHLVRVGWDAGPGPMQWPGEAGDGPRCGIARWRSSVPTT